MLGISTLVRKDPCPEAFTKDIQKADIKKKPYYPMFTECIYEQENLIYFFPQTLL